MVSTSPSPAPVSEPLDLDDNALAVLRERYLEKDEAPDTLFWRVARAVAEAEDNPEEWAPRFYEMIASRRFMPNTPTLFNAGRGRGNLSACFVIPIPDTREGIAKAVTSQMMTLAWGGGTGFSGSQLRPKGDAISGVHAHACGPVAVLRLLNQASMTITQNGIRQGANMFLLSVHHPDIEEFITVKNKDPQSISHFNISVAVTDQFMQAVKAGKDYPLINPRTQETVRQESAQRIWDMITESAWKTGDPGLFFIDQANRPEENPLLKNVGRIEATNPCGEQSLLPWESCNLGHLNLAKYIVIGEDWKPSFDDRAFISDIKTAVRFLDDVVTVNQFPVEEQAEMNRQTRRIGLGVMGVHDALIRLGIPYASQQALFTCEQWARVIQQESDTASLHLGKERGTYGSWEGSMHERQGQHFRNAWRRTVAPTGTTSIIADTSPGIEPWFSLAHVRKMHGGTLLKEINKDLLLALQSEGMTPERIDQLVQELLAGKSLQAIPDVSDKVKCLYMTAMDIAPEFHVRMQAIWQTFVDSAISKTVNMPNSASVADVAKTYLKAWGLNCKGITIFRDGCRQDGEQVLSHLKLKKPLDATGWLGSEGIYTVDVRSKSDGGSNGTSVSVSSNSQKASPGLYRHTETPVAHGRVRLPAVRDSITHRFQVGEQEGYLTVGLYEDGSAGEIFIFASAQGSTVRGLLDTWGATLSIALQWGVPLSDLVRKMKNQRFEPYGFTDNPEIRNAHSIVDYIARWLEIRFLEPPVQPDVISGNDHRYEVYGFTCPDCGCLMVTQEGCAKCPNCAYSKC